MVSSLVVSRPAGDSGTASAAHRNPSPHSRSPSSLSIPNGRNNTTTQHHHHLNNSATTSSSQSQFYFHSAAPSVSSKAHSQKSSVSDSASSHQQQYEQQLQQQYRLQQQQYHQQQLSQHSQQGHVQTVPRRGMRRVRSQYPRDSTENHVEYILVASFDIDRGSIMEHQYPGPISGDEHMLAELMLPDQAHVRSQDWTIFFLHKDTTEDEELKDEKRKRRERRNGKGAQEGNGPSDSTTDLNGGHGEEADVQSLGSDETDSDNASDDSNSSEGPPLIYVLNLVNTKQDNSVKRGAVVKAMAICTRHSFLHIYKPLLLLALEEYFRAPRPETLASLYDAANSMDLSLLPKLTYLEKFILQHSDAKDLFVEKFDYLIQQKMIENAEAQQDSEGMLATTPPRPLPRDTHEFESRVFYNGIPVPVKVPTATSAEMVGDFSLIKLIQTFSAPHASSPQPFSVHPHLTTSGPLTHPIVVLVNALLTQKRIIFLGHNRPSGEVAEVVLAACALASGDILRGFTRHAFPYTDLTKIDDLLEVPGFIAGVTNPAFAYKAEWWDLLCDISTGRMKISSKIEPATVTDGLRSFQQQQQQYHYQNQHAQGHAKDSSSSGGSSGSGSSANANASNDPAQDNAFMESLLQSIASRHGENAIRSRWRDWISKFTRIAAAFEETVYGASALCIARPETASSAITPGGGEGTDGGGFGVSGHGYVWPDEASRQRELAGNANRVEAWRLTRSYCNYVQDLAYMYTKRPIKGLDFMHQHDRLSKLKLSHDQSAAIYLAFSAAVDWGIGDERGAFELEEEGIGMGGGDTNGGGGGGGSGGGAESIGGDSLSGTSYVDIDPDAANSLGLGNTGSNSINTTTTTTDSDTGASSTNKILLSPEDIQIKKPTEAKHPQPQKSKRTPTPTAIITNTTINTTTTTLRPHHHHHHHFNRPLRYDITNQLLSVVAESNAGLFYISLGLFHPRADVRNAVVALLDGLVDHPAGKHFWAGLGRFAKLAFWRIKKSAGDGTSTGTGTGTGTSTSAGLGYSSTNGNAYANGSASASASANSSASQAGGTNTGVNTGVGVDVSVNSNSNTNTNTTSTHNSNSIGSGGGGNGGNGGNGG